jgi:hypothetical protein
MDKKIKNKIGNSFPKTIKAGRNEKSPFGELKKKSIFE